MKYWFSETGELQLRIVDPDPARRETEPEYLARHAALNYEDLEASDPSVHTSAQNENGRPA